MSFKLNWPTFSPEFMEKATAQLTTALNKGEKPANIVGRIEVKELNMGTKPPDLEILEIGDLQEERFRGIFKMNYAGDAYIELQTKVQANPLRTPSHTLKINNCSGILAANTPLVVPMRLRISNLVLRGIIVLVVDKHKGVTLVFKNDPLEKVDVNSTFDNIPNIRRFLQAQIELQLRKMFGEELPALVHGLSLVYLSQKNGTLIDTRTNTLGDRSGKEHDEIGSLDSGYQSYMDETFPLPSVHHDTGWQREKWLGNSSVDEHEDDSAWVYGYTFYRNLSAVCGATDYGLKNLSAPRPVVNERVLVRHRALERREWENISDPGLSGYGHRRHSLGSYGGVSVQSLPSPDYYPRRRPLHLELFTTRPRIPEKARSSVELDSAFQDWVTTKGAANWNERVEPELVNSRTTLSPTLNPLAAHLANLLSANHTIAPHTQTSDLTHITYRTRPIRLRSSNSSDISATETASTVSTTSSKWRTRRVMKLKLPKGVEVPKALISPGLRDRLNDLHHQRLHHHGQHPSGSSSTSSSTSPIGSSRYGGSPSVRSDGQTRPSERKMLRTLSSGTLYSMHTVVTSTSAASSSASNTTTATARTVTQHSLAASARRPPIPHETPSYNRHQAHTRRDRHHHHPHYPHHAGTPPAPLTPTPTQAPPLPPSSVMMAATITPTMLPPPSTAFGTPSDISTQTSSLKTSY
ncbi:hypothetical protein BC832DRAFT_276459 [Gaertneriomyces semiglobifer]|nr:hypothetical protein BC832DRAFT_276459 [Gaertneriomyces semiglobifer]